MASISSTGSTSLDVSSLVAQLVAAERAPADARLNRSKSQTQAQLSALGMFKSALSGLQSSLGALKTSAAFATRKAQSSDDTRVAVSAAANAPAGRYSLVVDTLASAHKLASGAYAAATTAVGTGTLHIAVGSSSFDLDLTAPDNTLADLRDAINDAPDNPGVRASLITADDGVHLVLQSSEPGTAHALRVTRSGGDGALDALVYDPGVLENLDEVSPADDARIHVDGFLRTASTNSITGAIEGLTLNLVAADPAKTVTVEVARDRGAVTTALQGFVQAYNTFVAVTATVTRYDPSSRQGAALIGDAAVRGIAQGLRGVLGNEVAGLPAALNGLGDLGIGAALDGTLTLDTAKLDAAMAADADGVARLLNGDDGVLTQLRTRLDAHLAADGQIQAKTHGLESQMDDLADRKLDLDRRMESVASRLRAQYTALDTLLSQLQSTSNFLTQQLAQFKSNSSG